MQACEWSVSFSCQQVSRVKAEVHKPFTWPRWLMSHAEVLANISHV